MHLIKMHTCSWRKWRHLNILMSTYVQMEIQSADTQLLGWSRIFSRTHLPSLSNLLLLFCPKTTYKTQFSSLASDTKLHIVSPVPFSTTTVHFQHLLACTLLISHLFTYLFYPLCLFSALWSFNVLNKYIYNLIFTLFLLGTFSILSQYN